MKIALIAHDQKKPQMIEFVTKFKGVLETINCGHRNHWKTNHRGHRPFRRTYAIRTLRRRPADWKHGSPG